jgi:large subunit ribosomal protein L4
MLRADLYNNKNEKIGTVDLPERIFGVRWNADLVQQALSAQLANSRRHSAHVKNRAEVSGGGRKPWRQKGTGRARHGSIRSPLWRHGGVTHGPTAERIFKVKLNKKMRQKAVFAVLSRRLKDNEVKFVDSFNISEPKTKIFAGVLTNLLSSKRLNTAIISKDGKISRAGRNLKEVKIINPKVLNVYDLLKYKMILIEKESLPIIETHYNAAR